jgi:hypothetical protein
MTADEPTCRSNLLHAAELWAQFLTTEQLATVYATGIIACRPHSKLGNLEVIVRVTPRAPSTPG